MAHDTDDAIIILLMISDDDGTLVPDATVYQWCH